LENKKGFTFGIITSVHSQYYLVDCVRSIIEMNIPYENYEIIIVGNCNIPSQGNITVIPFNEYIKPLWITKKKNIITENSSFENISYSHDYIEFDRQWYEGFLKFGDDWDICMNHMLNLDGTRGLDWMGLPDDPVYGNVVFPYEYKGSKGMYVPGNYWVAKRKVMQEFPLNEDFVWDEGEDIEWSKRVLGGYPQRWLKNLQDFENGKIRIKEHKYVFNPLSKVRFLKQKYVPVDFLIEYDGHSGKESRPFESTPENYYYLNFNERPERV